MKKKALILFLLPSLCFAQVDYSKVPKQEYNKYRYEPAQQQEQIQQQQQNQRRKANTNQHYVSPSQSNQNPKSLTDKYKHLYNNRATQDNCWSKAATTYGLDPWLLLAYAKVESSFNSNAINRNKDSARSLDVGMMQINSFWLPSIAKFGISQRDLLDPCLSLFVGSWIIRQNIQRFGYNIDGIGAYNAPNNISLRRNYGQKVYRAYHEITQDLYYAQQ